MKKIVALVLSLVMALSLCTVAFADVKDGDTLYDKDGKEYTFVAEKAKKNGSGNIAFFQGEEGTDTYVKCAKGTKDAIALYEDEEVLNGDTAVLYVVEEENVYYQLTAEKFVKAEKWSCTNDEHADAWLDDGVYYVEADEDEIGQNMLVEDGKIVEVVEDDTYIQGSHLLYQYKSKEVSTGVYVYKCAFCGKEFNAAMVKAYAGKNYVEYEITADLWGAINGPEQNTNWGKYVTKVLKSLNLDADDFDYGTLYLIGEAKADTTNTGVSSPKTFDAGIAMYVGMSLLSVAGGAAVIGKKKEF